MSTESARKKIAIVGGTGDARRSFRALVESIGEVEVFWEASSTGDCRVLIRDLRPDFLFLFVNRTDEIDDLVSKVDPHDVHVILVLGDLGGPEAVQALRSGARGVVSPDPDPAFLRRLLECVSAGELWAGRDVLEQVLESARARSGGPIRPVRAFQSPVQVNGSRAGEKRFGLTSRELDIVRHVVDGRTNREIARIFSISENTVKFHLRGAYDKTGVHNRLELAVFAANHSLVGPGTPPASGGAGREG